MGMALQNKRWVRIWPFLNLSVARVCSGKERLIIDAIQVGTVKVRWFSPSYLSKTFSSNSWVTDSAAGATAYSCGLKTYNNAIAVDPNQKPCGTLLEAAKGKWNLSIFTDESLAKGMMTGLWNFVIFTFQGIVTKDMVTGATPGLDPSVFTYS